jgi:hypothetical protein
MSQTKTLRCDHCAREITTLRTVEWDAADWTVCYPPQSRCFDFCPGCWQELTARFVGLRPLP